MEAARTGWIGGSGVFVLAEAAATDADDDEYGTSLMRIAYRWEMN
jgi:hypothetical protein